MNECPILPKMGMIVVSNTLTALWHFLFHMVLSRLSKGLMNTNKIIRLYMILEDDPNSL